MAESSRSQFGFLFENFYRLLAQPIFYRADRGVNSESARSQFTDAYLLIGQMADSPMGQARKEFKAARARLGSTHSYLCIVSVRGSAVWPLGSRVGRLCHLAKRAAIWQWQIFTCPKWRATDEQVWKKSRQLERVWIPRIRSGRIVLASGSDVWPLGCRGSVTWRRGARLSLDGRAFSSRPVPDPRSSQKLPKAKTIK